METIRATVARVELNEPKRRELNQLLNDFISHLLSIGFSRAPSLCRESTSLRSFVSDV